ncbi:MAG TPA: hypothetical protein VFT78_05345 [Hanamia sp.]|jgi:hypothetical protein|nr:hypothetical protein [Hanamia sp.]
MKKVLLFIILLRPVLTNAQRERLGNHEIKTDRKGNIISWYSNEPGKAWSHVVQLVWHFWDTMRTDVNGLPYYMNHQVWRQGIDDPRGIGGDQFSMALSSWRLLYEFTGDERIKQNMTFIIDYYLSHSLSPSNASWPDIPYPYNTLVLSGVYDGDMILGKDFSQPDKAASFAWQLLQFYKMVTPPDFPRGTEKHYLQSAVDIANTLANHVKQGDADNSPLPFKVNAITGETGRLQNNNGNGTEVGLSNYTTNWSSSLELFEALRKMKVGDTIAYKKAFDIILKWMIRYPLQNNKWGPFFEDVPGFSNTQINAITFARYIMMHRQYFPDWNQQVKRIIQWVHQTLGNKTWQKYGVFVTNEQTAYMVPGNSHSSREASTELEYMALTGDTEYLPNAVRELNWATYMVDADGKNRYPHDDYWLTDGYGDYVRHFLRAMAAKPELAPEDENHLLSTTSVVQSIGYTKNIHYTTWDSAGKEVFRLRQRPANIFFDGKIPASNESLQWKALNKGGILVIKRTKNRNVTIDF